MDRRTVRSRRALLGVFLLDVSSVTVFVVRALTRRQSEDVDLAVAAVASVLPGAAAVTLELRRSVPAVEVVGLFLGGSAIGTAGTLASVRRHGWSPPSVALLLGANLVGVPYLTLVQALRRGNPVDVPRSPARVARMAAQAGRRELGVDPRVTATHAPEAPPPDD
ncbi:hypothetical protein ACFEMC_11340 [Kineococcus sp. DHX-1]|uniref:hypothetical protein n=1 Tax=Kineococcus sp. DHX-1 TaxID=3349638 RepID=UPI0036D34FAE